ncbi:LapA family protein [Veronia pacifica]|uniref:Probable lipopolysaccharide assembly protein A n=1 Tax=Veronia pacifica TaxID=1080227 RepID=A0A1C3EM50_9GAMM|nr:lipopolysaccharide assembly protein LapA domain-containing protein [Veronia pacifica]ODA34308.1 hypothetical protein A8L45_07110 [Veronia pacifica]
MKIIGIVVLIFSFLVALALGAQNQEIVSFNYLLAKGEFRLSVLLGAIFGIGFILGWISCGMLYLKARLSASSLQKKVNRQQKELDKLRVDPVKEH